MKVCVKCCIEKDFDSFGKLNSSTDGYRRDCKECRKKYTLENKDKIKKYKSEYYISNKEHVLSKNKEYLLNNKDRMDKYYRDYWIENVDKKRENYKNWKSNNVEHLKEYKKYYYHNVTMKDSLKRLKYTIRSSVKRFIKNKSKSTEKIIGCSYNELLKYLESKFEDWMNWENYGLYNGELNYGWDIDHKIPLSSGKTEEKIIELNHYTNLQPLCSKINRDIKKDLIYENN